MALIYEKKKGRRGVIVLSSTKVIPNRLGYMVMETFDEKSSFSPRIFRTPTGAIKSAKKKLRR